MFLKCNEISQIQIFCTGMMDGHGQIARKNDGPRAVPVPVLPVLKKSDIARLCPCILLGQLPEIKSDNEMLFENKIILLFF